ncbi:MAG: hypothetical protein EP346_13590 [Bacteroidetes bacterium]|nr:MAG: hypothetical protein EP346_13590 [Bacteroidota bacterium]
MKAAFLSLGLICSAPLMAQHSNFQQVFYQLEELPGFYNEFMEQYMYDVNQNLNQSFFYNLQSNAEVMDTGEFSVGLLFGAGRIFPPNSVYSRKSPLYTNDNLSFTGGRVPTIFNGVKNGEIRFVFLDPTTGNPMVNPQNGADVEFYLSTPPSFNSRYAYAGSAAISLGYGIGYGTEVRAYITPKFGAALGSVSDELSATNDFAYGASVKHEITTWIPYLHSRGWHISADFAYSAFTANIRGKFVGDFDTEIAVEASPQYEILASSSVEGIDYSIATTGGRFFIGKTFSWIELSAYMGYLSNSYKMNSVGSISATLRDKTGSNPDTNLELKDFANYSGNNTSLFYGASTTIGKGWARWTLAYTNNGDHYGSMGINFYF